MRLPTKFKPGSNEPFRMREAGERGAAAGRCTFVATLLHSVLDVSVHRRQLLADGRTINTFGQAFANAQHDANANLEI